MNQSGFSLTEGLVGLAIVAVAATAILTSRSYYVVSDKGLRRACESHAASIIAAVQEETYYRQIGNFLPTGVARQAPNGTFTSDTRSVAAAAYWPVGTPNITANPTDPTNPLPNPPNPVVRFGAVLNNALLIQGSLRSLTTIYNATAGVRCAYGAYAPLTALALPSNLTLIPGAPAPVITMRLEPYNIQNGVEYCVAGVPAPAPIYIVPRSITDATRHAYQDGSGTYADGDYLLDRPNLTTGPPPLPAPLEVGTDMSIANARIGHMQFGLPAAITDANANQLGMRMSVRVQYTYEGNNQDCVVSQKFEYPIDRTPPPRPVAEVVANTNTSIAATPTVLRDLRTSPGAVSAADATVRIGYNTFAVEGGVQFICKDLSFIRRSVTNLACIRGGGPIVGYDQPMAEFNPANNTMAGMDSVPNSTPKFPTNGEQFFDWHDGAARLDHWRPCDQMSLCGVAPVAAAAVPPANPLALTLTYTNLPAGCVMRFEAVAVDTAGNRSGVRSAGVASQTLLGQASVTSTAFDLNSTLNPTTVNFTVGDNEIYYPTCGNGDRYDGNSISSPPLAAGAVNPATNYQSPYYVSGLGIYCRPHPVPACQTVPYNTAGCAVDLPYVTYEWIAGAGSLGTYPNGYYTTRAAGTCCVGVGCTATN